MELSKFDWKSPVGELTLLSDGKTICMCDWKYRKMRQSIDKRFSDHFQVEVVSKSDDIIELTIHQLTEYFEKKRKTFDIPLNLIGTEFQINVWNELIKIPYGKTNSYLELSRKLGNEKAIRAVATANGANAISIIVPCHRIIGSSGDLVGYAGGLPAKKKLLSLESDFIQKSLF